MIFFVHSSLILSFYYFINYFIIIIILLLLFSLSHLSIFSPLFSTYPPYLCPCPLTSKTYPLLFFLFFTFALTSPIFFLDFSSTTPHSHRTPTRPLTGTPTQPPIFFSSYSSILHPLTSNSTHHSHTHDPSFSLPTLLPFFSSNFLIIFLFFSFFHFSKKSSTVTATGRTTCQSPSTNHYRSVTPFSFLSFPHFLITLIFHLFLLI